MAHIRSFFHGPLCKSEELAVKLKPLGVEERAVLLKLKQKECEKRQLPFDGELHAWDTRYFMTQVPLRKTLEKMINRTFKRNLVHLYTQKYSCHTSG